MTTRKSRTGTFGPAQRLLRSVLKMTEQREATVVSDYMGTRIYPISPGNQVGEGTVLELSLLEEHIEEAVAMGGLVVVRQRLAYPAAGLGEATPLIERTGMACMSAQCGHGVWVGMTAGQTKAYRSGRTRRANLPRSSDPMNDLIVYRDWPSDSVDTNRD